MRFFDWLKGGLREARDPRVEQWRQEWTAAAERPSAEQIQKLTAELSQLGLDEDDLEIEREMLEALERLAALESSVAANGLPLVETGHRMVGSDTCHFTAPASMPDEGGQPGGRLLLTSTRAAFAGGAASRTLPWHSVVKAVHTDRDLLLIRSDNNTGARFRCNSYGDALCAAFVARRLIAASGPRGPRI